MAENMATTPSTDPIAELHDVRFSYDAGTHWTLDGIDLTIMPGERICLTGANGSGKSTLARLICGLAAPDSGTVRLLGIPVFTTAGGPDTEAYRAARRGIGAVFQKPEDQIVTTILEDDVAFGPENLAVPRDTIGERIDSALHAVGLRRQRQEDPTRMSGGQQQRAAIAGMLAMRPRLLVLDEPTAMLDKTARVDVMRVLDELQQQGTTIVHVTHRPEETAHATRVLRLEHGRLTDMATAPTTIAGTTSTAGTTSMAGISEAAREKRLADAGIAPTDQSAVTDPLVIIKHVSYAYPGSVTPALNDLSLTIDRGETVAIMGPNGAGKSTLARIICALARPTSGMVVVDGIPLYHANRRQRARIHASVGYIMQHPEHQLFASSVAEDIAFGPGNQGLGESEIAQRVEETMKLLHIDYLAACSPFALSGGQQRLVAIAGVLACQPKLIVMDEPAAGLDADARQRLHALIGHLHEQGVAVILVTHDEDEARAIANRIVRIQPAANADAHGAHPHVDDSATPPHAESAVERGERPRAGGLVSSSVIARLDPRVKLPVFLLVMMCAFAISNAYQLAVGACATAVVLAASRMGPRRLWRSIRVFLVLFVLMGLANVFFVRTGTVLAAIGPIPITDDGLAVSALYICRFAMVIVLGAVFLATTTPTAITDAVDALFSPLCKFGVHTQEVALVFSLALRFMPTLAAETRAIMDAQSARGGSIETGSPIRRIHAMAAIIVPVFAGALRHADNLSLALDARCYEEGIDRTHWRAMRITPHDIVFITGAVLTVLGIALFAFLP